MFYSSYSRISYIVVFTILSVILVNTAGSNDSPHILLITLDTTRADHLPCYGYPENTMPFLSRLATEKGITFKQAFSPCPLTLPAHSSLMTGLTPEQHGVLDNGLFSLDQNYTTVAELLKKRGYATYAYISAAVLDRLYGLDQGFDLYDDAVRMGRRNYFNYKERAASQVVDTILTQQKQWKSPWFCWVHFYDPHDPYVPPPPFDTQFKQAYDGELAFVDANLEKLFLALEANGSWKAERDIAIIVGDHGEDLGDHGEITHGLLLTPATLHVPMIWLLPGLKTNTIERPVEITAVPGALLSFLDTPADFIARQQDPLVSFNATEGTTSPLMLSTFMPYFSFRWSPLLGLLDYPYLYIAGPDQGLFHIARDLKLEHDISPDFSQKVAAYGARIEAYKQKIMLKAVPTVTELDKLEELRSLGYVLSVPDKADFDPFALPSPRRMVPVYSEFLDGKQLVKKGLWSEALAKFSGLLERDPDNTLVLSNIASVYEHFQQFDKAEKVLRRVIEILPEMDYPYAQLGRFYMTRGRLSEARGFLQKALSRNRRNAEVYLVLFFLELKENNSAGALKVLEQALTNKVEDPEIYTILAQHARSEGKAEKALDFIGRAEHLNPQGEDIKIEKARILCSNPNSGQDECFTHLKEAIARYSWSADFWIVAADWFSSQNKPGESYFCWLRAADRKLMYQNEANRIRNTIERYRSHGIQPVDPKLE